MKKRVITLILSLCMIFPMMLVHSYAAEATCDTVISEENFNLEHEFDSNLAVIFPAAEDDGHDILDLFEDELVEDENEKRILNYMFFTFVIVIIVRLVLFFAGVI